MAVDKHPSRRPSPPRKPPAVAPTVGSSGQPSVGYGAPHNLQVKNPNKSEFAHHFGHASRPGDE